MYGGIDLCGEQTHDGPDAYSYVAGQTHGVHTDSAVYIVRNPWRQR